MSRFLVLGLFLGLTVGGLTAWADGDSPAEREAFALEFVRANHPELARLLEQLKPMKPADYDKAIREIYPISKSLANLKTHDPRRYEVGLEVWKARSRVELLTAQLAGAPDLEFQPRPQFGRADVLPGVSASSPEGRLRAAVQMQFEAELNQQKVERELLVARLKKLDETIKRLESNRETILEARSRGLLKKSQRARRPDVGKTASDSASPAPSGLKGESKP